MQTPWSRRAQMRRQQEAEAADVSAWLEQIREGVEAERGLPLPVGTEKKAS